MAKVKFGLLVKLVAKVGQEDAVASFLASAEPLVQAETFTTAWFAYRASKDVFYLTDVFASDDDRQRHLTGAIAKALMTKAGELFAEPPKIEPVDVLGAKLPG